MSPASAIFTPAFDPPPPEIEGLCEAVEEEQQQLQRAIQKQERLQKQQQLRLLRIQQAERQRQQLLERGGGDVRAPVRLLILDDIDTDDEEEEEDEFNFDAETPGVRSCGSGRGGDGGAALAGTRGLEGRGSGKSGVSEPSPRSTIGPFFQSISIQSTCSPETSDVESGEGARRRNNQAKGRGLDDSGGSESGSANDAAASDQQEGSRLGLLIGRASTTGKEAATEIAAAALRALRKGGSEGTNGGGGKAGRPPVSPRTASGNKGMWDAGFGAVPPAIDLLASAAGEVSRGNKQSGKGSDDDKCSFSGPLQARLGASSKNGTLKSSWMEERGNGKMTMELDSTEEHESDGGCSPGDSWKGGQTRLRRMAALPMAPGARFKAYTEQSSPWLSGWKGSKSANSSLKAPDSEGESSRLAKLSKKHLAFSPAEFGSATRIVLPWEVDGGVGGSNDGGCGEASRSRHVAWSADCDEGGKSGGEAMGDSATPVAFLLPVRSLSPSSASASSGQRYVDCPLRPRIPLLRGPNVIGRRDLVTREDSACLAAAAAAAAGAAAAGGGGAAAAAVAAYHAGGGGPRGDGEGLCWPLLGREGKNPVVIRPATTLGPATAHASASALTPPTLAPTTAATGAAAVAASAPAGQQKAEIFPARVVLWQRLNSEGVLREGEILELVPYGLAYRFTFAVPSAAAAAPAAAAAAAAAATDIAASAAATTATASGLTTGGNDDVAACGCRQERNDQLSTAASPASFRLLHTPGLPRHANMDSVSLSDLFQAPQKAEGREVSTFEAPQKWILYPSLISTRHAPLLTHLTLVPPPPTHPPRCSPLFRSSLFVTARASFSPFGLDLMLSLFSSPYSPPLVFFPPLSLPHSPCPVPLPPFFSPLIHLSPFSSPHSPLPDLCSSPSPLFFSHSLLLKPVNGEPLEWAIICNYMVDLEWLIQECPVLLTVPRVVLMHGERSDTAAAAMQAMLPPSFHLHRPPLPLPFGTHHTKAFLLGRRASLSVIIHTANLIAVDWHFKSQGLWQQTFPVKRRGFRGVERDGGGVEGSGEGGGEAVLGKRRRCEGFGVERGGNGWEGMVPVGKSVCGEGGAEGRGTRGDDGMRMWEREGRVGEGNGRGGRRMQEDSAGAEDRSCCCCCCCCCPGDGNREEKGARTDAAETAAAAAEAEAAAAECSGSHGEEFEEDLVRYFGSLGWSGCNVVVMTSGGGEEGVGEAGREWREGGVEGEGCRRAEGEKGRRTVPVGREEAMEEGGKGGS
ncbi:unnamed protein product [Closterium sp. NIES-65]|nr:unnamed protein product [Closterium sp. NIES-65]